MEERDAAPECFHHDDNQTIDHTDCPKNHYSILDLDTTVKEHNAADESNDGSLAEIGLHEYNRHCCRRSQERFLPRIVKTIIDVGLVCGNDQGQVKDQVQFHELGGL